MVILPPFDSLKTWVSLQLCGKLSWVWNNMEASEEQFLNLSQNKIKMYDHFAFWA